MSDKDEVEIEYAVFNRNGVMVKRGSEYWCEEFAAKLNSTDILGSGESLGGAPFEVVKRMVTTTPWIGQFDEFEDGTE